ncbi:hypothetical protein DPMN_187674 [Dreissena polymorpha]|uniref:Uncharacterized protein n=1 Tax=Dreissena polymorpha TaxID=45954 RepID=A0A9D4DPI1_DREPO|nr:hypothetical protein DPMN_187674 [Dreissena polymorpha]
MFDRRGSFKTINPMTTRHPHGPTRQQHAIITAPTRTFPDSHGRAISRKKRG